MNSEHFESAPNLKEKYLAQADPEGYLAVAAFATEELNAQSKSVAALLDGEEGTAPEYHLGKGLRYKGASGDYSSMKIHLDDLDEFVGRVQKYYTP